jgi:hypothetical protein
VSALDKPPLHRGHNSMPLHARDVRAWRPRRLG